MNLFVEQELHEAAQQVADHFGTTHSEAMRTLATIGIDVMKKSEMQLPDPSPALLARYTPIAKARFGCRSEGKVAQLADRLARTHLAQLAAAASAPPKSGDELVRALAAQTGMDEAEIVAALAERMADLASMLKPDADMPDGAPADQAVAGRRLAKGTKMFPAAPGETRAAYCARVLRQSRARKRLEKLAPKKGK